MQRNTLGTHSNHRKKPLGDLSKLVTHYYEMVFN